MAKDGYHRRVALETRVAKPRGTRTVFDASAPGGLFFGSWGLVLFFVGAQAVLCEGPQGGDLAWCCQRTQQA